MEEDDTYNYEDNKHYNHYNDSDSEGSESEIKPEENQKYHNAWKELITPNLNFYEFWNNLVLAGDDIRFCKTVDTSEQNCKHLILFLKIIEENITTCPDENLTDLESLSRSFMSLAKEYDRSTEANIINKINNVYQTIQTKKQNSIKQLLETIKIKNEIITKLEDKIKSLTTSTIEPAVSFVQINTSQREDNASTMRRVDKSDEPLLLYQCSACKVNLDKGAFSNTQQKLRFNRKCKTCVASNVTTHVASNVASNVTTHVASNVTTHAASNVDSV